MNKLTTIRADLVHILRASASTAPLLAPSTELAPNAPRATSDAEASGMASIPEPLVLADQKAGEARELIAKGSYDPAIELLATALELRCLRALSCLGPHTARESRLS